MHYLVSYLMVDGLLLEENTYRVDHINQRLVEAIDVCEDTIADRGCARTENRNPRKTTFVLCSFSYLLVRFYLQIHEYLLYTLFTIHVFTMLACSIGVIILVHPSECSQIRQIDNMSPAHVFCPRCKYILNL